MAGAQDLGRRLVPADAPADLSLLQWNTLADGLARGSFVYAPPESLEWGARAERLLDGIVRHEGLQGCPDVVCLQEVDRYAEFFLPRLGALGYTGVFAPKAEGRDGLCLFVREARIALEGVETLRYREAESGAPQSQLALLARLSLRDGRRLCVATTHLRAKVGFEAQRAEQVRQLLSVLEAARAGPGGDVPLIVACDLNDVPGSPAHRAMTSGGPGLSSAYADLCGGQEPAWTTWKVREDGEVRRTIDYVFYSPGRLRPTAALSIPAEEQVARERLPSWQYPSDHLSLLVTFELG